MLGFTAVLFYPPPAKKTLLLIEYEAVWALEAGTRPQLRGSVQLHHRTKYRVKQTHSQANQQIPCVTEAQGSSPYAEGTDTNLFPEPD